MPFFSLENEDKKAYFCNVGGGGVQKLHFALSDWLHSYPMVKKEFRRVTMRMTKFSTGLFRLFVAMMMVALAFSQVAVPAQAKGTQPPGLERVQLAPLSLGEVQNYYGRLADIQGKIGVVLELQDRPAALIYAPRTAQSAAQAQSQVSLIKNRQESVMQSLQSMGVQATELYRTQKAYNGIWLRVDSKDVAKLAKLSGVKAIHPIISKTLDHTTSIPLIGAPEVWGGSAALQGNGIKIGVIDTGIDYVHTNFGGSGVYAGQDYTTLGEAVNVFPTAKVVGGWDFAGDSYNADPSSATFDPIPSPDPDPMDCNGHGSHVSGSAAGYGVNTDGTTYVESGADTYAALKDLASPDYISKFRIGPGVAPKAQLYALRVFGCEGSTDLTELAIEWAMDPNGDGNMSDHLDVINMSLGSSFGSAYDTSAVASDNAAQAGVIVVASAGNSGDVYYITGAPGMAQYAISVASSVDSGAVISGFDVNSAPVITPGTYPAVEADFGPATGVFSLTGDLAYASPATGCTVITGVTGKIALIDRGTCTFQAKVDNATAAGATGVLVVNNVAGFPFVMGGTSATIPAMMTSQTVGTNLKADILAGTVNVTLTSAYRNTVVETDSTNLDTISSFSSRGPARTGTRLKPDVSAPGDTIFSTANGTSNQGTSFNGTSMSSPHVAGVMALLKQMHPSWSVAELKSLVMNTATNDLWTSSGHTLNHTPTRAGAGRVSVSNASLASVVAYNAANPGEVSLGFGEQAVLGTQSFVKSITLKNTGASDVEYLAAIDEYYQANPGLTFVLLDASDVSLDHPFTVPAGGTIDIKVKVTAVAADLTRARDASIATADIYGYRRSRFAESGGYVTLTPTAVGGSEPVLRVPVHIAARPASAMSVAEDRISLPAAATGTVSLTPVGTPVDTVDDTSLVTVLELMGTSPNDASSAGYNDAADLQYVGATSDYPLYPFAASSMFFGVATYGKWDTPNAVEFDIYIDVNEDGTDDYVVFNSSLGLFTGTTDDVMLSVFCPLPYNSATCDFWSYVNGWSGTYNTNLFNNNVMALVVPFAGIGLVDGVNTDFDFYVVTYSRDAAGAVDVTDLMHYDVANQSFDTVDAVGTGEPQWWDASAYSPTFDIGYDKAAIAANHSKGLLLLHHHNTAASSAQILTFNYHYYLPFISK